jgi:hypothetical protein
LLNTGDRYISPEVRTLDIREELELEVRRLLERMQVSPAPKPEAFDRLSIPSSPELMWQ